MEIWHFATEEICFGKRDIKSLNPVCQRLSRGRQTFGLQMKEDSSSKNKESNISWIKI